MHACQSSYLQSHVLGYLVRQQLVHKVRREYQRTVDDIQPSELLQNLPLSLANETIHWRHKNILCFPTFTTQELTDPCHDTHHSQSLAESDEERDNSVSTKGTTHETEEDIQTSTRNHSPLVTTDCPPCAPSTFQLTDEVRDVRQFDEASLDCLIEPLPRNREALLELKSQLSMELLWIKQAIASRQEVSDCLVHAHRNITYQCVKHLQYLQLRQQLQTEQSAQNSS